VGEAIREAIPETILEGRPADPEARRNTQLAA
jgi:hypothetical protein